VPCEAEVIIGVERDAAGTRLGTVEEVMLAPQLDAPAPELALDAQLEKAWNLGTTLCGVRILTDPPVTNDQIEHLTLSSGDTPFRSARDAQT